MYLELYRGYWTLFIDGRATFSFASLADAVMRVPEAEVFS
jgi:hypothetical protein